MLNLKCSECNTEFTINNELDKGTHVSCSICQVLVMDGFDWEDREGEQEENEDNFIGSDQAYRAYQKILSYDNGDAEIAEYNEMVTLFVDGAIHELFLNDYITYKEFGGIKYIFVV